MTAVNRMESVIFRSSCNTTVGNMAVKCLEMELIKMQLETKVLSPLLKPHQMVK